MTAHVHNKQRLENCLAAAGLRSTRQRELVYQILMDKRDHPTADEVYARVRRLMPSISLATVYNCLETLVHCGLVKMVNLERSPTRFCPNLHEHAHFHDARTGQVFDIAIDDQLLSSLRGILPGNCEVSSIEVNFHGKTESSPTQNQTVQTI